MTKESVTFLCDENIITKIQTVADKDHEGNFSIVLRKILKSWSESND